MSSPAAGGATLEEAGRPLATNFSRWVGLPPTLACMTACQLDPNRRGELRRPVAFPSWCSASCLWRLAQRGGKDAQLLAVLGNGSAGHFDTLLAKDVGDLLVSKWGALLIYQV